MSKKQATPEAKQKGLLDGLDDFYEKLLRPSELDPWSPEALAKERAGMRAIEMFVAAFKEKPTPKE